MSRAIVLSLEEVGVVEVSRLIQAGLLRPGRITQRGAIVHELTPSGIGAFEDFCRAPDAASELEAATDEHRDEAEALREENRDLEQLRDRMRDAAVTLAHAAAACKSTPKSVLDAIKALGELIEDAQTPSFDNIAK